MSEMEFLSLFPISRHSWRRPQIQRCTHCGFWKRRWLRDHYPPHQLTGNRTLNNQIVADLSQTFSRFLKATMFLYIYITFTFTFTLHLHLFI